MAGETGFPREGLRHFRREEFAHAEKVDRRVLTLLDEIRERAGVPIRVTSDYRTMEEHMALYPDRLSRPNSPHVRGTAVDFAPIPFTATTRMKTLAAICGLFSESGGSLALGLEIANRHFHIDLDGVLERPHFWLGKSK